MFTTQTNIEHSSATKLLLVEDNDLDVELFEFYYRRSKVQLPIARAQHGEHALELLHEAFNDANADIRFIVFLDLNMPRMSGFELLEKIKDAPWRSKLKVHILTTSDQPDDRSLAGKYDIKNYLVKPITVQLITQLIGS